MKHYREKTILILGSSGLIGRSLFKYYLDKYTLIASDINFEKNKLKNDNYKNVHFINTDITKESSIKKLISKVKSKNLKIDVVINCSYPKTSDWGRDFIGSSEKSLKLNISNQLSSCILLCRNFYHYFNEYGGGNLILVSSIQGIRSPKFNHYSKTKMSSPIEYTAVKSALISIVK